MRLKLAMMLFVYVPMFKHPSRMLCNLDVGVAIFIDSLGANFFVVSRHMAFLKLRLLSSNINAFDAFVPRFMSFWELRSDIALLKPSACFCCQVLWSLMQLQCEGFIVALGD